MCVYTAHTPTDTQTNQQIRLKLAYYHVVTAVMTNKGTRENERRETQDREGDLKKSTRQW